MDERQISVSASLGLAASRGEQDAADLLRDADLAMCAAKRDRGSGWRWYRPAMHERVRERHELEDELRGALGEGALTCAYQPIVDLTEGTDRMVEALARWDHVDLGPVSPQILAAIAEETGMIGMLGRQVLAAATTEAVGWGGEGPDVAVDGTVTELVAPGYLQQLQETLTRTGLVARRLVLELTESDLATDDQALPTVLQELRAIRCRLGQGYHLARPMPPAAFRDRVATPAATSGVVTAG